MRSFLRGGLRVHTNVLSMTLSRVPKSAAVFWKPCTNPIGKNVCLRFCLSGGCSRHIQITSHLHAEQLYDTASTQIPKLYARKGQSASLSSKKINPQPKLRTNGSLRSTISGKTYTTLRTDCNFNLMSLDSDNITVMNFVSHPFKPMDLTYT